MNKYSVGSIIEDSDGDQYQINRILKKQNSVLVILCTIISSDSMLQSEKCVIKILERTPETTETTKYIDYEERANKLFNHLNICKLVKYAIQKENIWMVFEYCNQQDIQIYLEQNNPNIEIRLDFIKQICQGFRYLKVDLKKQYNYEFFHRDIKPQNIFLHIDQEGKKIIKLGDFGMSKIQGVNSKKTMTKITMGSHGYIAPEIIENYLYSEKSDIYSLGCVFYYILTGQSLISTPKKNFNGEYQKQLQDLLEEELKKIKEKKLNFREGIDQKYCNLVANMVQFDPNDRPSFEEIFKQLQINDCSYKKNESFISITTEIHDDQQQLLKKNDIISNDQIQEQNQSIQTKTQLYIFIYSKNRQNLKEFRDIIPEKQLSFKVGENKGLYELHTTFHKQMLRDQSSIIILLDNDTKIQLKELQELYQSQIKDNYQKVRFYIAVFEDNLSKDEIKLVKNCAKNECKVAFISISRQQEKKQLMLNLLQEIQNLASKDYKEFQAKKRINNDCTFILKKNKNEVKLKERCCLR